jgi:2-octaprenyl-6-methoxyphenol hydroxylase
MDMTATSPDSAPTSPVAVLGGGPSGLIAAALLGIRGIAVILLAPAGPADPRTTALMQGSLDILTTIGVWPDLATEAGPLRHLRMVDDTRRLVRAPELSFDAAEIGLQAFGWNVPNALLVPALHAQLEGMASVRVVPAKAAAVTAQDDSVLIDLEDGSRLSCALLIAADGRNSLSREAAGVTSRSWQYRQSALALNLKHERPHHQTSTEFHTASGPFTLVPLPGNRSSLVAVLTPGDAARLKALDDEALGAELTRRSHNLLGRVTPDGPRGVFPLAGSVARQFGARRIALVGEAAHLLPPIGAQGLNLGVRDADTIARLAAEAVIAGRDPGAAAVLDAYTSMRRKDVWPRTLAVDALNRSLIADVLPADMARGLGLRLVGRIPALRRMAMRTGIGLR